MKGQSISINTIVVAAIALIVMVLVVMIFTRNFIGWGRNTRACASNGGTCMPTDDVGDRCTGQLKSVKAYECYDLAGKVDADQACCVDVSGDIYYEG